MKQITPHLWFDTQAKEAAELYASLFEDSSVTHVTTLRDTPSGDCDVVSFTLAGQPFQAISAGPAFTVNPSISFLVSCATADEVDALWGPLHEGGQDLMPLDGYDFSPRYGWTQDRFGVSWQVMQTDGEISQKVMPMLMFVGDVCGKAEEAMRFYASVFDDAEVGDITRYTGQEGPDPAGTVQFATFRLEATHFAAMDSAHEHAFRFNEAVSLIVHCDDQEEIDRFWSQLSAFPEHEQCGWLKDRYGVSWQIVPRVLSEMLSDPEEETVQRVTQTFLPMKKLDIATLEAAYRSQ